MIYRPFFLWGKLALARRSSAKFLIPSRWRDCTQLHRYASIGLSVDAMEMIAGAPFGHGQELRHMRRKGMPERSPTTEPGGLLSLAVCLWLALYSMLSLRLVALVQVAVTRSEENYGM
jgi:hypothetical protein